jgi:beta-lactamase class A
MPIRCLCLLLATSILFVGSEKTLLAQSKMPSEIKEISVPELEAELGRISKLVSGTVGVAALHLESGRLVTYNGATHFPMASTYKVPIAVQLLTKVERGQASLSTMVPLRPVDFRPGSNLSVLMSDPGVILSLRNLFDLALSVSDNTASDRVLAAAGGPADVNARLKELGIEEMEVDRSTLQVLLAFGGIEGAIKDEEFTFPAYQKLTVAIPKDKEAQAMKAAAEDARDSSTPAAMAKLLGKIWRGEALSPEHTDLLLTTMKRSEGATRIRGMLPPGVPPRPAHKTGTLTGGGLICANDVGIVELPANGGHVAIAVFVKPSAQEMPQVEEAIAQATRTLLDYFILANTK